MKLLENHSLLEHNTFGIDAQCRYFVEYDSETDLKTFLSEGLPKYNLPYFHIGSGSNILFVGDYAGIILHSAILGKEVVAEDNAAVWLRVGAGENWDELVAWCVEQGYYGLENLSYIPGEVGAAAVQNIGAYGKEAADFIDRVEAVAVADGQFRVFSQAECNYAYRYSCFKGDEKGKYVITQVVLRLSKSFHPDLTYGGLAREVQERHLDPASLTPAQLRALVIAIRQSKLPEPSVIGSAGSFFMNPVVSEAKAQSLLALYPNIPHYAVAGGQKIPAGWLIEQCGWKGKCRGAAGVYEKQALVLINLGGATGEEIRQLSEEIQQVVKEKFGIAIYPEVNFI